MIPYYCIKNDQQFTHTGGQNNSVRFAFFFQALSQLLNGRIESAGRKCRHIENTSHVFSPASNVHFSVMASRGTVPRRHPDQGRNFLAIQTTQLGQVGDQHGAGLRTNTGDTLKNPIFVFEIVIRFDVFPNQQVNFIDLEIERLDHFLNAFFDLRMMEHLQAIGFLSSQIIELAAASYQFSQFDGLRRRMRFSGRFDNLCKLGQNVCVNGIGFGSLPHPVGKIAYLPGIDNDHRQCGVEQFGGQWALVTTRRFQNNALNRMWFERSAEGAMTHRGVGQGCFENIGTCGDTDCVFGDVDANMSLAMSTPT